MAKYNNQKFVWQEFFVGNSIFPKVLGSLAGYRQISALSGILT